MKVFAFHGIARIHFGGLGQRVLLDVETGHPFGTAIQALCRGSLIWLLKRGCVKGIHFGTTKESNLSFGRPP